MVPETLPYNNYRGDGVAKQFDYDFLITNSNQLIVEKIDGFDVVERLVEGVDYEIKNIGNQKGGYIIYPIEGSLHEVLSADETISLQLTLPVEQISEYGQSSALDLNNIEYSLDYLTRLIQIFKRKLELCVKVDEGVNYTPDDLIDTLNNNVVTTLEYVNVANSKAEEAKNYLEQSKESLVEIENKIVANDVKMAETLKQAQTAESNAIKSLATTIKFNNITNCIKEILQNIKLELNNGTLTLKAGSKVIMPNGANVFDEIAIQNNASQTWTFNGKGVVVYKSNTNTLMIVPLAQTSSGTTAPTVTTIFWLWHDTTDNKVKFTSNNGETWNDGWSLPVGLITGTNSGITSIDEVFNGLGFIGGTIFANKGIKYLIPNGRNEDGTLKNLEVETTKVSTISIAAPRTDTYITLMANGQISISSILSSGLAYYDEEKNLFYQNHVDKGGGACVVGIFSCSATGVDKFEPKYAFRAVDFNDFKQVKRYVVEKSDKSILPSWYTVYSDGWIEQGGVSTAGVDNATITFTKPYTTNLYSVFLNLKGYRSSSQQNISPNNQTAQNFQITCNGGTEYQNPINWEAKGY